MSRDNPSRSIPALAVPVFVALVVYGVALFSPRLLYDGDTFWQVKAGLEMLDMRRIFTTDPFSYSMAGAPWHTHEWLSEIFLGLAYKAAGWSGVVILGGLAVAATTLIVGVWLARFVPPLTTLAALALAFYAMSYSLLVRPHLLALPLLALWAVELLRAREQDRAPSPWLLPLMTAWANMHGSYIFGLLLVGPLALEALIEAAPDKRLQAVRRWGVFGLLALGAALITPHGLNGLIFPFQVLSLNSLKDIGEWRSADFSQPTGLEIALLATLLVVFVRGVRLSWLRALLLLGLLHMALQHIRQAVVLATLAPLLLARPLGEALEPAHERRLGMWLKPVLAVGLAGLLAISAVRLADPLARKDGAHSPVSAFNSTPRDLRGRRVLNGYALGGFLIFHDVPVFIDGRADMYGDAFTEDYLRIMRSTEPEVLEAAIEKWRFDWMFLESNTGAVKAMEKVPGWTKTWSDERATVFIRDDYGRSASAPSSRIR